MLLVLHLSPKVARGCTHLEQGHIKHHEVCFLPLITTHLLLLCFCPLFIPKRCKRGVHASSGGVKHHEVCFPPLITTHLMFKVSLCLILTRFPGVNEIKKHLLGLTSNTYKDPCGESYLFAPEGVPYYSTKCFLMFFLCKQLDLSFHTSFSFSMPTCSAIFP